MKKTQFILAIFFLLLVIGCNNNNPNILYQPDEKSMQNITVSDDAKIELIKGDNGKALRFSCGGKNQAPNIIIHDSTNFCKLSNYHYLAADITNPGTEEVMVEVRLDANGWLNNGQLVPPGETRTLLLNIFRGSFPEYYSKKLFAMNNHPGGFVHVPGFNTDSIFKISFLIVCPSKPTTVQISNIRGEGDVILPTKEELEKDFFPLVDAFGQYRHVNWPGKTQNLEELKQSVISERENIKKHPRPSEWNKYGGWLKGHELKATGHFRTQKINGKWWLIDPDGYLFWSHGMGGVSIGGTSVTITDREFYFTDLPDSAKYKEYYGTRNWAPFGYYKNKITRSFDQTGWNMQRKYGDDWRKKIADLAHERLANWGQNSMGAWSSPDIYLESKTPYTPIIMIRSRKIEGSKGHWTKYSDPYDSSFLENLTARIKDIEKSTTDPYCIGYFVDNETTWGTPTSVANWTIASPADQPAKIKMLDFLKKRYNNIEELNEKWGTRFPSWDNFMNGTKPLDIQNKDTKDFTLIAVNEYFKKVSSTLKKMAPNKLYLGPRFDFHFYPSEENLNPWDFRNNWVVNVAVPYCDVISFNRYRHSAADLRPGDFDKPVIVGEWHHVSPEKGSYYTSAENYTESLEIRAEKYEYFIKSCLSNCYIIGTHYFQMFDQPTVGRADGENFSCGFIDICDRPHTQMVDISRKIGNELYTLRYNN